MEMEGDCGMPYRGIWEEPPFLMIYTCHEDVRLGRSTMTKSYRGLASSNAASTWLAVEVRSF